MKLDLVLLNVFNFVIFCYYFRTYLFGLTFGDSWSYIELKLGPSIKTRTLKSFITVVSIEFSPMSRMVPNWDIVSSR